jgi:hypothetical protein
VTEYLELATGRITYDKNTNHDSRLDFVDYQLYPCFKPKILVAIVTLRRQSPVKMLISQQNKRKGRSIIDRQRQGIRGGDDHLRVNGSLSESSDRKRAGHCEWES